MPAWESQSNTMFLIQTLRLGDSVHATSPKKRELSYDKSRSLILVRPSSNRAFHVRVLRGDHFASIL